MDGVLRQSFLPSGRQQNSKGTENNIGNILRSIQEEHMNFEKFSGSSSFVKADASNEHMDKSELKPNLLKQSIRNIMNPYGAEARRGQNLSNYHCSNYGIFSLSFSPVNPVSCSPFYQDCHNGPYELEPQSQLFYMQEENSNMEGNSCFNEPAKVKFKLNPEAKEYIPISILSQVNGDLKPVIEKRVNYPQTAVIFGSADSDYGFIRENFDDKFKPSCSCNQISISKQISAGMCENTSNKYDSGSSNSTILKDKTTECLDSFANNQSQMRNTEMSKGSSFAEDSPEKITSLDYQGSREANNFDSISADQALSQVNNTEMNEGNSFMEDIPEKILSPDYKGSREVNNFDYISAYPPQSQTNYTEMTEVSNSVETIPVNISKPYLGKLEVNNFDSITADKPLSQGNNTQFNEGNSYMEDIEKKNPSSDCDVSMEINNLHSVSVVDSKAQKSVDILEIGTDYIQSASEDCTSDESGAESENENGDSSEEEVTSEESDSSDENDECFEGLKSDESFIKFGSIDSNDSNIDDDCKNANGIKGLGSDSVNSKSGIFSFMCNPDSDSESCNAEDSDYDYDIFSVQLDDGWDLCSGGLEISAFISHCSPDICAINSSQSDLSVVDSKVFSDCTILCCDETCSIDVEELENVPDFALINERWEEEIDKNLALRTLTKVSFRDDVEIHSSIEWDRHGPWEQHARDRMRFARRINESEPIISKVLTPEHRFKIFQKLAKL